MVTHWLAALDRLAPTLSDAALRSALILAVAGMGTLAMRRASAAARHWVWLMAITGLLLLPALSATLPAWNVLPAPTQPPAPVHTILLPPALTETPAPLPTTTPPASLSNETPSPAIPNVTALRPSTPTSPTPPMLAQNPAIPTVVTPITPHLPLTSWLILLYLAGILSVLTHMALGYLSLWSLQRRSTRLTHGVWPTLLHHLRQRLAIRRPVHLLQSNKRTMPMTWGLWHARLLLPEDAATWPAEQRHAVLLHELGHVKRHDCLAQLLAQTACALYWFNPLVWIAWHRMQIERERACDDLVLTAGTRASTYAQHLLHTASALPALRFVSAAVAMARPSTLEERLRAILDPKRNRRTVSTGLALLTFTLLLATLLPVATLHAQATSATPSTTAVPLPPGYPVNGAIPQPPAYTTQTTTTTRAAIDPQPATSPSTLEQRMNERRQANLDAATLPAESRPAATSPSRGTTGRGTPAARGPFAPQVPLTPGEGPTCTLDATIYDLRLTPSQIGRLDLDALSKAAATPAAFEKALADLGTAQPLYRVSQSVRLANDAITIGTQLPYVTNSQNTARGIVNTVAYTSTGAIFTIAGKISTPTRIDLDMSIQLSALSESLTKITTDIKAPAFRAITMSQKGPVDAHQPFVVISLDAASPDAEGKAVAYIARITLGTPQSPTTRP